MSPLFVLVSSCIYYITILPTFQRTGSFFFGLLVDTPSWKTCQGLPGSDVFLSLPCCCLRPRKSGLQTRLYVCNHSAFQRVNTVGLFHDDDFGAQTHSLTLRPGNSHQWASSSLPLLPVPCFLQLLIICTHRPCLSTSIKTRIETSRRMNSQGILLPL